MPPRIVAENLAMPRGIVGRLIAREMNRRNANMNAFARSALDVGPSDRVLEIGFGGGLNLAPLLEKAASLTGVDPSPPMVAAARARHRKAVVAGKASFTEGRVEELPLDAGAFDKAITVNTIYFWSALESGFAELARVMRPGGRIAVGFLPAEHMAKMNMPPDVFTLRRSGEVIAALEATGFADVMLSRPSPETPWAVVVGRRAD